MSLIPHVPRSFLVRYAEELVNCCTPLEEVQAKGLTLQKASC